MVDLLESWVVGLGCKRVLQRACRFTYAHLGRMDAASARYRDASQFTGVRALVPALVPVGAGGVDILPAMRRWFLVFLTMMVFAQFSSAAARICCLNELAPAASSSELHTPSVATSLVTSLAAADDAHAVWAEDAQHPCDMGHCHCHHASVACGTEGRLHIGDAPRAVPDMGLLPLGSSHIPAGLDRPNWHRA